MLGSFERLRVGNAVTLTEETLLSGHRLQATYVLGTSCERFSKKCGHARLSAKILHNLLSLRSRSLGPSVNRCTLVVSIPFTVCGAEVPRFARANSRNLPVTPDSPSRARFMGVSLGLIHPPGCSAIQARRGI